MLTYILKRLALAVPTLLIVSIAVFALVRMVPGDPAQVLLGDAADEAALMALRSQIGLDQPLPVQFGKWLVSGISGDLGESIMTGEPVVETIIDRFLVSAPIVLIAMFFATLLSVAAGLLAARFQNRPIDLVVVITATVLLSIPSFWFGLLLLLLFGLKLGWVPVVGYVPFSESPLEALRYIALPVIALALVEAGVLTRMMRATSLEVLRLDYVLHARAKGLPERKILMRHVFPNAFAPTLTLVGLTLGNLLGGIVVMETVFTIPGLGRLMVDAVLARDYSVIQGCLLFSSLIYIFINLVVDLIYPVFDPRVVRQ